MPWRSGSTELLCLPVERLDAERLADFGASTGRQQQQQYGVVSSSTSSASTSSSSSSSTVTTGQSSIATGTVYQCNDAGAYGRYAVDTNSFGAGVNMPNCASMVALPLASATLTLQRWHPDLLADPYAIWQATSSLPAGWSFWTPMAGRRWRN